MLKVGYFSHSNISPSETFVYDSIKSLNKDPDINLQYISGLKKTVVVDFALKCINTNYYEKYDYYINILSRFAEIFGLGGVIRMKMQKRVAFQALQQSKIQTLDIAYIDYATSGVFVMEYLEKNKIPFIVHVHGYDITSSLNDSSYKNQLKVLLVKANAFIVASNYMKRRLVLLGCNEKKIHMIRLGIDSKAINPLEWKERVNTPPGIIYIGRMTEKKHPIALLHAFKIVHETLPQTTLSMIGDGHLAEEVKMEITKLGLEKSVKMYGALNRDQSFPILNKNWIYAQHSVTSTNGDTEGFAISLAEAALHELPVVSTIHNGITENVIDGRTGYLVPEYDYELMAEKIIYLIKNPTIAEQMGKTGRAHIMSICNPQERVAKIIELLQNVSS